MKPPRITYISNKGGQPFAATVGTRYIDRKPCETVDNFKERCKALQRIMMDE